MKLKVYGIIFSFLILQTSIIAPHCHFPPYRTNANAAPAARTNPPTPALTPAAAPLLVVALLLELVVELLVKLGLVTVLVVVLTPV